MAPPLIQRLRTQPLVLQFLVAGAGVMLAAMLVIGVWITARIEQSVVDNTASAAALYLGSFVAPISQELAANETLSEPATRALRESFEASGLGERIVAFRIWKPGSRVDLRHRPVDRRQALRADRGAQGRLVGPGQRQLRRPRHPPEHPRRRPGRAAAPRLRAAARGLVGPDHRRRRVLRGRDRPAPRPRQRPHDELAARRRGLLPTGLLLLGIVRAGGRTIARQEAMLREQVTESRTIAAQNSDLRRRAIGASARATAQAERSLRRVSADLHDGPAQYVALAAMRLDSMVPATARRPHARRRRSSAGAAERARRDPHDLARPVAARARPPERRRHRPPRRRQPPAAVRPRTSRCATTGRRTPRSTPRPHLPLPLPAGDAVERRPPRARRPVAVEVTARRDAVTARVRDEGPGFDPGAIAIRPDGGEGSRRASATAPRASAATLDIDARPGKGTTLVLRLPLGKGESQ